MQALRFDTEVAPHGAVQIPRLPLQEGTPVEVIVLVKEEHGEYEELLRAAETSLGFWDNAIDDEVWNDA